MGSPFPGMDPYLEDPVFWLDFHSRFVNCWCEALASNLPEDYEVGLGERVYLVENDPETRKLIYPDVALLHEDTWRAGSGAGGGLATLEPVTIPLTLLDGPRESYIEILHRPDRTLVAVLELLSPTNKGPAGQMEYLAKRQAILVQAVHLVELDLLVGGRRPPMRAAYPPGHYHYLVSRWEQRPDCQVYSWNLPQPLPCLPVPLRAPDADVIVDYGAVLATAFGRGRFGRRLRYEKPCPAPLGSEEMAWAAGQLTRPAT